MTQKSYPQPDDFIVAAQLAERGALVPVFYPPVVGAAAPPPWLYTAQPAHDPSAWMRGEQAFLYYPRAPADAALNRAGGSGAGGRRGNFFFSW